MKMPNPRRIAAGRLNRTKRKPLGEESRRRLREAAMRNRPWERSTGPRSEAGRQQAAKNLPNCTVASPTSFVNYASNLLHKLKRIRRVEQTPEGLAIVFGMSPEFFRQAELQEKRMAEKYAREWQSYIESLQAEFRSDVDENEQQPEP